MLRAFASSVPPFISTNHHINLSSAPSTPLSMRPGPPSHRLPEDRRPLGPQSSLPQAAPVAFGPGSLAPRLTRSSSLSVSGT